MNGKRWQFKSKTLRFHSIVFDWTHFEFSELFETSAPCTDSTKNFHQWPVSARSGKYRASALRQQSPLPLLWPVYPTPSSSTSQVWNTQTPTPSLSTQACPSLLVKPAPCGVICPRAQSWPYPPNNHHHQQPHCGLPLWHLWPGCELVTQSSCVWWMRTLVPWSLPEYRPTDLRPVWPGWICVALCNMWYSEQPHCLWYSGSRSWWPCSIIDNLFLLLDSHSNRENFQTPPCIITYAYKSTKPTEKETIANR